VCTDARHLVLASNARLLLSHQPFSCGKPLFHVFGVVLLWVIVTIVLSLGAFLMTSGGSPTLLPLLQIPVGNLSIGVSAMAEANLLSLFRFALLVRYRPLPAVLT
jgi:hypothetical protein